MYKKTLSPANIAVAVAAGLSAHAAFAQVPPTDKVKPLVKGQETTPTLDGAISEIGQGFFSQKNSQLKDPMLAPQVLEAVDNGASVKEAELSTEKNPPIVESKEAAASPALVEQEPQSKKASTQKTRDVKVVKNKAPSTRVTKSAVLDKNVKRVSPATLEVPDLSGYHPTEMMVQEAPEVAPASLYAAQPNTPVVVTEIVRIDSIDVGVPTHAEQETQPLPKIPEGEHVAVANASEVRASVPVVSAPAAQPNFFEWLLGKGHSPAKPTESVPAIAPFESAQSSPVVPSANVSATALAPVEEVTSPGANSAAGHWTPLSVNNSVDPGHKVTVSAAPSSASQSPTDARIRALQAEIDALKAIPIAVEQVEAPQVIRPSIYPDVPKVDPQETVHLPLAEPPTKLIKPPAVSKPKMVSAQKPSKHVDTAQTITIDSPRSITPAPDIVVQPSQVESKKHRVANPKWPGLSQTGDFIAFMEGSSRVSLETQEKLGEMVAMFRQHGIRKIVLTGTALRDEESEGLESSEFAMNRARNLKAAFQRAGFKGVIALADPKRARPGTTPRVGLVALN